MLGAGRWLSKTHPSDSTTSFMPPNLSRWYWPRAWRRSTPTARPGGWGAGVMLNRAKGDAVWPVFEEYRAQLASRRLKEVDDAYRDAAQLIAKDSHYPYSAIVVDETQDFGP